MANIETKELKMTIGGVQYPVGTELAKRDGNGNIIADTYLPVKGGTISGSLNVIGNLQKNGTDVALATAQNLTSVLGLGGFNTNIT